MRFGSLATIALGAALLGSSSAAAWTVETNEQGEALHWEQREIPFSINPSNELGLREEEVLEAAWAAMDAWERVGVGIRFVDAGETDVQETALDGVNAIYFDPDWEDEEGHGDRVALATTWSDESGAIREFDIALDEFGWDWSVEGETDGLDLQSVLTHELGHVLGLGHSGVPAATMYWSTRAGELGKRTLDEDDEEGLRALYPFEEEAVACNAVPSSTPPGGLVLGALLAGLAWRSRRRGD